MAQPISVGTEADPRIYHEGLDHDVKGHDKESNGFQSDGVGAVGQAHKPQSRKLHDSAVTFEEYQHYAHQTRAEEDALTKTGYETTIWSLVWPSKSGPHAGGNDGAKIDAKHNLADRNVRSHISDEEWTNASRALRTATRGAVFYLITTDILGPFSLPYAFASMGYGPGIALYTVFAGMAGYSGYLLWEMFLGLDSYQYPIRSFGDLGFRLYGMWMRHLLNVLQAIQLLLNVGLIVISNGEALSQAVKFNLCFAICCLVWCLVGFFVGQIRTLQKFGWLANAAVWINLLCMFVSMGGVANGPPNYAGASGAAGANLGDGSSVVPDANGNFPAVQTSGGVPASGQGFAGQVNGAMSAVFAYGGSMIFPEFMAEMRHPKDFLTAMWAAQAFIYVWYMFYGLFVYSYQGQYVISPSYLGVSQYNIQTAGNVFAMVSAVIAAALYGNIGLKVVYNNIFVELFRAPEMTRLPGKIAYAALIPVYWALAFVIAAGIPNFIGLTGVVAAFCILNFTYTFPPLLSIAFYSKKGAMRDGEGFDPATGETRTHDSGFKRLARGFAAHRAWLSSFNIVYLMGALSLSALGAYGSITVLMDAFASGATNSYVCHSPLDG